MRRRQGERAFRRAAAGLDELKRARDQLRTPDEVLGMILGDAIQVAKFTGALATANRDVPIPARPPADLPAWLTTAYVQQSQDSVTERSDELVAWLQAGLEQDGAEQAPGSSQDQQQSPADQAMLEQIRDAMPFVQQGASALKKASDSLTIEQFLEANQQQAEGIRALQEAARAIIESKGTHRADICRSSHDHVGLSSS